MLDKKQTGIEGEHKALNLLLSKGYTLCERNYRYKRGEIDIILKDESNSQLVFVEVKTRKNNSFGEPEEFVSNRQINSILKVAEQYILETSWAGMIRFDIVSITLETKEILHCEDAFG